MVPGSWAHGPSRCLKACGRVIVSIFGFERLFYPAETIVGPWPITGDMACARRSQPRRPGPGTRLSLAELPPVPGLRGGRVAVWQRAAGSPSGGCLSSTVHALGAVDAASHPDGLWFVTVSFTENAVGMFVRTASRTRVTVCGANLRRARWLSARPASQLRGEPAAPACWRSVRPAPPPPAAGQLPPSLAWTRCRLTGSPLLSLVLPSRSLVAGVFSLLTFTRIFPPQCLCVSSSVPRVPAEGVPSDFIRAEHQTKSRFVAVPPSSQLTVLGRPHAAHGPSGLGRWSVG